MGLFFREIKVSAPLMKHTCDSDKRAIAESIYTRAAAERAALSMQDFPTYTSRSRYFFFLGLLLMCWVYTAGVYTRSHHCDTAHEIFRMKFRGKTFMEKSVKDNIKRRIKSRVISRICIIKIHRRKTDGYIRIYVHQG